ncbi:MAG: ATP-binding cassette domain-containing protein [Gemmatimonas sp.]|nr:ATP-binding cassette domain-containing protein [Gemmatimonas sp.]
MGRRVSVSVSARLEVDSFRLDVSFDAHRGITALFGPSGAGKTLTLRTIAGLTVPDSGRIELDGRVLLDTQRAINLPPRARNIGYVFQQYALFPHLSVFRNVGFGIRGLPAEEGRERIGRLLELVGLEGLGKRRPTQLSGGQQQRVALARALATHPELLLLDEPFAAVDLRVRRRLRAELRRIHDVTGTPMLLVTHDVTEVRQLADSLVLIDGGRVHRSGPTAALLADRSDPLISEFLDESVT